MQIRFFPWRWSELQIKIFSYLFCRIFSISYSILHCKMLFENGFKRRIRWRNNGVGATVDSEMKMHWNEEVLRILALHFWGLSDLVSYDGRILESKCYTSNFTEPYNFKAFSFLCNLCTIDYEFFRRCLLVILQVKIDWEISKMQPFKNWEFPFCNLTLSAEKTEFA